MEPYDELAEVVSGRFPGGPGPRLVGIGGAVAVGKSSVAADLAAALDGRVEVLATDAFLWPNAVLAERGLTYRKGFPSRSTSTDSSAV